jgi:hypothetical protein
MVHRVRAENLPDATQPRLKVLVEQSSPDLDRPQLPLENERRLAHIERQSAVCYADAEDLAKRHFKLAKAIKNRRPK